MPKEKTPFEALSRSSAQTPWVGEPCLYLPMSKHEITRAWDELDYLDRVFDALMGKFLRQQGMLLNDDAIFMGFGNVPAEERRWMALVPVEVGAPPKRSIERYGTYGPFLRGIFPHAIEWQCWRAFLRKIEQKLGLDETGGQKQAEKEFVFKSNSRSDPPACLVEVSATIHRNVNSCEGSILFQAQPRVQADSTPGRKLVLSEKLVLEEKHPWYDDRAYSG